MKEYYKWNSHINSTLHVIYRSSNNVRQLCFKWPSMSQHWHNNCEQLSNNLAVYRSTQLCQINQSWKQNDTHSLAPCTVILIGTWHICHTHQLWYAAVQWYLLALGTFVTHTSCDMQLYCDTYWHLAYLSHTPAVICSCTVILIGTWNICHTHQLWYAAVQWYLLALGTFVTHTSCDMQLYCDTYWHLEHLSHTPAVICSCTVLLIGTWHICHTHQLWYAAVQWYLLALGTFVTHTSCDMQLYSDTYWHLAHLSHIPAVICSCTVILIGTWNICHTHQLW